MNLHQMPAPVFLTLADIPGAILKKKSEKCRKSDLEWWLKCRRFLSKNVITKAHLCNRVRQRKSSDENFFLTNSDPGLCHVCF